MRFRDAAARLQQLQELQEQPKAQLPAAELQPPDDGAPPAALPQLLVGSMRKHLSPAKGAARLPRTYSVGSFSTAGARARALTRPSRPSPP